MNGTKRAMRLLAALCIVMAVPADAKHLSYGWQKVDDLRLFFREGGPTTAPTIVFLHGNPSSSIMYEELMQRLTDAQPLHVLAVDYPSFGYSDAPDHRAYRYTFDNVAATVRKFLSARGITRYGLFMQDYGVPIGFRLLAEDPASITTVMIQNGVIHLDGFPSAQDEKGELRLHWLNRNPNVDARRAAYVAQLSFPRADTWSESSHMSPDALLLMMASEQRPGVIEARNDLWFDYGSNVKSYPLWQAALHRAKMPVLVLWGSQDDFFTTPGALAYLHDAPQAEIHILNTVHFATLDVPDELAVLVGRFLEKNRSTLEP
jgi:pimeloyl-ACP methyl ester carboxylesterase